MIEIIEIENKSKIPISLLLEGDENEAFIRQYLPRSKAYGVNAGGCLVAVCLVEEYSSRTGEIVNIAVAPDYRRRGYARKLISHALNKAKHDGMKRMVAQTCRESLSSMPLYLNAGFVLESVDKDYFVRNYPAPVVEDGIVCRDRARLVKKI